jgi:hypothetical protein
VIALGVGIPALGQNAPESILPPGFGEPAPTPTPRATRTGDAPPVVRTQTAPPPVVPTTPGLPPSIVGLPMPGETPTPLPTPTATPTGLMPVRYDMPPFARRSLARVGPVDLMGGGLPAGAFGDANGRYVEALMRSLDMPIASRWLSIALRRALLSKVDTPAAINGADFAAERAWLLLRMGESVSARAVVQSVDNQDYTPKLYEMAMQSALATGDPAALCPVVAGGVTLGRERGWLLAKAMCAGLAGQPGKVNALFKDARKQGIRDGIDLLLAQKVAGSATGGQQAVTIEWAGIDRLSAWRFGLALASGTDIPQELLDGTQRHVDSWRALSPNLLTPARAKVAERAALRGVLSSTALIDLYGAIAEEGDNSLPAMGIARDLQTAYSGADVAARLSAMKSLWDASKTTDGRYARLILTAHAATRVPVGAEGADADSIVAAMLSAGMDRSAQKWRRAVGASSDARAMLLLADPDSRGSTYAAISSYAGNGELAERKRRMLFAGMAGLGRMSNADIEAGARALDVKIGAENAWTRAIAKAAEGNQPGTVLLLAAIGMQTPQWRGVSPEALYHITLALRAVGLEGEARMISAEAIARL